jgi:type II secretory pathway pseudopilin PulG
MRFERSKPIQSQRGLRAFSITETLIGMGILGTAVSAVLSGVTTGFTAMRMSRENLRATQIMLEKVETIRLYSWHQINSNGFIPTNFIANYDPYSGTNSGPLYYGTMTVSNCTIGASYSNDMKTVNVRVQWTTGTLQRSREFTSYISRYGLQDYIY